MITYTEHEIISERVQAALIICGIAGSAFLFGGLFGLCGIRIEGSAAVGGGDPRTAAALMMLTSLIGLRILAEAASYRLILDCRAHCYEARTSFLGRTRCRVGPFSDFLKLRLDSHNRGGIEGALYLQWQNPRRSAIWLANYARLSEAEMELDRLSELTGIQGESSDYFRLQKSV